MILVCIRFLSQFTGSCGLKGLQIIVCPLAVIHLISSWNIKLFNYSPAIAVVIGIPANRITRIASSRLRYKIYTYIACLQQFPISASRLAQWQATCSFYLGTQPSLIIRYAVLKVITRNSQLLATDKQANHYQTQIHQQEWKTPQTQCMHDNSSMLTHCIITL